MKFNLVIFALLACWGLGVYANEEADKMSFFDKLRVQEEQEYLALQNDIITMSDADYKAMLTRRMEGSFTESASTQKLAIVVNVSEQMNQGFLQKLLGSQPEPKMMAINSVQKMLSKQGLSKASQLILKREASSDDGTLHFQKVEGVFTQSEYELLLANPDVTDIVSVKSGDTSSTMETFYVPKGRIIPSPVAKTYDDDFIDEGLYQEVMSRLDQRESVGISIGFHQPPEFYENYTPEKEAVQLTVVEEFLADLEHLNIEVHDKRTFGLSVTVDREAAKAIYEDSRVNYIRLAKVGEGVYLDEWN